MFYGRCASSPIRSPPESCCFLSLKKKIPPSPFKEGTQASAQLIKLLEIILALEDVLANSQVHLHPFLQIIRPLPMV